MDSAPVQVRLCTSRSECHPLPTIGTLIHLSNGARRTQDMHVAEVISREDVRQCRGVYHLVSGYDQISDTFSTTNNCYVAKGFVCTLNKTARVDNATPSRFSYVYTWQWIPYSTGAQQCRRRCVYDSYNTMTGNTTLEVVAPSFLSGNESTRALIIEEMVCLCN